MEAALEVHLAEVGWQVVPVVLGVMMGGGSSDIRNRCNRSRIHSCRTALLHHHHRRDCRTDSSRTC